MCTFLICWDQQEDISNLDMIKLKNKISMRENPNAILDSTKALQRLVWKKSTGVLRSVHTSKVMNKYTSMESF